MASSPGIFETMRSAAIVLVFVYSQPLYDTNHKITLNLKAQTLKLAV